MQQYTIGAALTTEDESVVALVWAVPTSTCLFTPEQAELLAAQLQKHATVSRKERAIRMRRAATGTPVTKQ